MYKVLVIDDDLDIRESVKIILETKGYDVITAANGKDGVEAAIQNNPELIILDVIMDNDTEGFTASYEIRKDKSIKNTPILMLTSINQKSNFNFNPETDGEFLPVDCFFEKPVQPVDLLLKVEELLNLPKEKINVSGTKSVL